MFYKYLAQGKFRNYNIDNVIDTIRRYGLFNNENESKNYGFGAFEKDGVVDIYFGNLHIQRINTKKEISTRIFIKSPNEEGWDFNGTNYSEPINEVYRVYSNCIIEITGEGKFYNDAYRSGSWDKYVYKSMKNLENTILGITDQSRFNEIYKKK